MTLATIVALMTHSSRELAGYIKNNVAVLKDTVDDGAFATPNSMAEVDLANASRELRQTADMLDAMRSRLIANDKPTGTVSPALVAAE